MRAPAPDGALRGIAAWQRADSPRAPQTRPVLLEGPCGSGKSALLQHLAAVTGAPRLCLGAPAALACLSVGRAQSHNCGDYIRFTVNPLSAI